MNDNADMLYDRIVLLFQLSNVHHKSIPHIEDKVPESMTKKIDNILNVFGEEEENESLLTGVYGSVRVDGTTGGFNGDIEDGERSIGEGDSD